MGDRVKFINPATGQGFIDHYRTARRAKEVVLAYKTQFLKDGSKGVYAEYLGKATPHITADPEIKRQFGL